MNATVLVMAFDDPTALDYASHLAGRESGAVLLAPAALVRRADQNVESWELNAEGDSRLADRLRSRPVDSLVVFVGRAWSNDRFDALTRVLESLPTEGMIGVCLVSTFRVHFGDRRAAEVEAEMTRRVRAAGRRCSVLRPAFVLSPRSKPTAGLKRWSRWFPVLPAHWRAACIDGAELFAAIDRERTDRSSTPRIPATLLGANRSWREQVRRLSHSGGRAPVVANRSLVDICAAMLDPLWRIALFAVSRVAPGLRTLNFDTLRPQSRRELLELYNRHNYPHVRIVGYNNGVNHFGHRHPDRTIVSTCSSADGGDLRGDSAVFDAGATIADARRLLQAAGKQLPVLPNYSYVSLGTAFFVPIHGSSCTLTTLGDAIQRIVAYDPVADRIVRASRRDAEFTKWMYDTESKLLLLRLTVSVSNRTSYCVRRRELSNPTASGLLAEFDDVEAANIEMRKNRAASSAVQVSKYYARPMEDAETIELPRDSMGSVWDRIERTPIVAWLFHGFVRRFGYHVELFLTREQFQQFWETHAELPLTKIQLRFIRKDGMPHSPCRDADRISVDLFVMRKHKSRLQSYLVENFHDLRSNPGKHSA